MAKTSSCHLDIKKMQELIENLKQKASVQVGVFQGASARKEEGLTNAALARIHELGSPEHNIPARSMLKVPIGDHINQIMAPFKGKAESFLMKGKLKDLYKLIGIAAEKVVDGAFNSGGYGKWQPLRSSTILAKLKGSLHRRQLTRAHIFAGNIGMAILINTAQLRKAFSSRVVMRF